MQTRSLTMLILNGKSAGNEIVRQSVHALRQAGCAIEVRVTWEQSDCTRFVKEAMTLQAATVIAGGGDGTINAIATELATLSPATVLGLLPLGTANDFASSAGIAEDIETALQLAVFGQAHAIDLVRVNQSRYFINMVTGGFGTRITTNTPEKLKAALGGVSYFIHGLMRMDQLVAERCEITGTNFSWQGEALVLGIGNGRQAGGGRALCPQAFINDGLLDISIVTSQALLPAIMHSLIGDDNNPNIITSRSASFNISAEHEMTFNLDGEPMCGKQFCIEVIPNALQCRLPLSCPLLNE